ncbi:MAG: lipoprotein [Legionella sp.]|nr:lipoprotein [Legionella sp.]
MKHFFFISLIIFCVCSCGQKGPLYLPESHALAQHR